MSLHLMSSNLHYFGEVEEGTRRSEHLAMVAEGR